MQIHLGSILVHKHSMHTFYEFFRSYFRGNVDAAGDRMRSLEAVGAQAHDVPSLLAQVRSESGMVRAQLTHLAELFHAMGKHKHHMRSTQHTHTHTHKIR